MTNDLKETLLRFAGQHAVLTYHRPFANLVGSIEGGLMLSQLLYWHDADDPWTPVPDTRWERLMGEDCITPYRIRQAVDEMREQGYLHTDVRKRDDGTPCKHYRVDLDAFMHVWEDHVGTSDDGDPQASPPAEDATDGPSMSRAQGDLDALVRTPPESVTPQIAADAWNAFANQMRDNGHSIPRVRKVTDQREAWVQDQRAELWPVMREVFDQIRTSPFLRGETGWTVSFDWVWRSEDHYTKIVEGVYHDEQDASSSGPSDDESGPEADPYDNVGY